MKDISSLVLIWSLVMTCSPAYAHRPTMSDGTAVDAEHAIEYQDVQISRVVYHEVTEKAPWVWVTFEVDHSQELFLQIGVPVLDRLREYRPSLVLLGPGLPEVSLPFEFPSGLGGLILDTRQIENPREFYEPFTSTRSWILAEQDVQLPEAGRYYVVAYNPQAEPGKLWAALGRKEVWGAKDMLKMPRIIADVRQFHELAAVGDAISQSGEERMVFDFDGAASSGKWVPVNDDVMGGVSEGTAHVTDDGALRFTGRISLENNGGFASIRSRPVSFDLSGYDGLSIRVRGDGNKYALTLQTDVVIMAGSYQAKFSTIKDTWQEIHLYFADFEANSFGRVLPNAQPLNIGRIRQLGFLISDKQDGPFKLEVDWIKASGTSAIDPVIAAPDKPTAAQNLIQLAINRGVPLFNSGQHQACGDIYEVTAQSLLALTVDDLSASSSERLRDALREVARTTDDAERAWILRLALDYTLESLPANKPRAEDTDLGTP